MSGGSPAAPLQTEKTEIPQLWIARLSLSRKIAGEIYGQNMRTIREYLITLPPGFCGARPPRTPHPDRAVFGGFTTGLLSKRLAHGAAWLLAPVSKCFLGWWHQN